MLHLTHVELIEFNKRIAAFQRLQRDTQGEHNKLQGFIATMGRKYGVDGFQYRLDERTGEIHVQQPPMHFKLTDSLNALGVQNVDWPESE